MPMSKKITLAKKQLEKELTTLSSEWKITPKQTKLSRQFSFNNAVEALSFIAKIIVHAEVLQHHPDIEFSNVNVKCSLTTHKLKCLTKLDFAMASRIDTLYTEYLAKANS